MTRSAPSSPAEPTTVTRSPTRPCWHPATCRPTAPRSPPPTSDETAFSHRDALVEFVARAGWTDPAEDQARISIARRYGAAIEPYASGVYVNDLTDEGQEGVRRAYGPGQMARLAALKDRYDPDNIFHLNHNIPAASPQRAPAPPAHTNDRSETRGVDPSIGVAVLKYACSTSTG